MRKALIVWGGWGGHRPKEQADILAGFLDADGFSPIVTDDIGRLGASDIGQMDLVIPMITSAEIDRDASIRLSDAIRAGTGLGGNHAALATSFRNAVHFHFVAGVQWVAHPGDIIDFRVNITRPDDPITAGIADFDYRSEQYYLHYDPSVEILATTTFSGAYDEAFATSPCRSSSSATSAGDGCSTRRSATRLKSWRTRRRKPCCGAA